MCFLLVVVLLLRYVLVVIAVLSFCCCQHSIIKALQFDLFTQGIFPFDIFHHNLRSPPLQEGLKLQQMQIPVIDRQLGIDLHLTFFRKYEILIQIKEH